MFKFSEGTNYMMPAHFGGWPGQPQAATYHDVTSIAVSYETDPGMLTAFFPEPFEMTESVLSIQYSMCRRVDWMGGGGYNLITVGAPAAYAHGRQRIEGLYVLVVREPLWRSAHRERHGLRGEWRARAFAELSLVLRAAGGSRRRHHPTHIRDVPRAGICRAFLLPDSS